MFRRPPRSPLFPSTTLFRSRDSLSHRGVGIERADVLEPLVADPRKRLDLAGDDRRLEPGGLELRQGALEAEERERSEEHTSELQSPCNLVCRLLLEKKNTTN